MGSRNDTTKQILATVVAAAGFAVSVGATAKVAPLPRGADVEELAGNCGIGSFPQTSKAGMYNSLCSSMEDAEKCLGFIKQHFQATGATHTTHQPDKMAYCLEELSEVLGADATP